MRAEIDITMRDGAWFGEGMYRLPGGDWLPRDADGRTD